jgi:hypothetical protein
LNDAKVIALDVILGLLRTDILQRFSYLLTNFPLTSSTIANMICILIRIARHSQETASIIINFEELLPTIAKFADLKYKSDHIVIASSLKLLRVLAAWDKSWADILTSKVYDFRTNLPQYLVLESGSVSCTVEALRLWDCVSRLEVCNDIYIDAFPIIMKYLLALRGAIEHDDYQSEKVSLTVSCTLFKALGAIARTSRNPSNPVQWRHLSDIFNMMEGILVPLVNKIAFSDDKKDEMMIRLFIASLNCFDELWRCFSLEEDENKVNERAQKLHDKLFQPLVTCKLFKECINCSIARSGLLSKLKDGRDRDPSNLPSVGSVAENGVIVPSSSESSPFFLLNATLNLHNTVFRTNITKVSEYLCQNQQELYKYMEQFSMSGCGKLVSSWFVADETSFVFNLSQLFAADHSLRSQLNLVKICDTLVKCVGSRNKSIIRKSFDMLMTEMFKQVDLCSELSKLNLNEASMEDSFKRVVDTYSAILPKISSESVSVSSLTVTNNGEVLLPSDWRYLPLLDIYTRSEQNKGLNWERDLELLKVCLHCVLLDLRAVDKVSSKEAALHFSRMSTLFLLTSNQSFFMDPIVQRLLREFMSLLLQKTSTVPTFQWAIPGIDSFADYYTRLLSQFFADSYGNSVFSAFVLYPALKNLKLRAALFWENCEHLRTFTLKKDDLPEGFPYQNLSEETTNYIADVDANIVRGCVKAILSGTVVSQRNPFLYEVAVENIRRAASSPDDNISSVVKRVANSLISLGINFN